MGLWTWLRGLREQESDSDRPLPYVDPLRAGRHPFQIYMLALCVIAGTPYLFGYATAEAVEKQLPVGLALGWGLMLLFGAILALIGSFWRGSIANALTMERVGLSLTGGAAMVYGLCVVGARDLMAPLWTIGILAGYLLLRVPLSQRWSAKTTQRLSDTLTGLGLALMVACTTLLMFTDARVVLVGAFVIIGFGMSCLTRGRDIAAIFARAKDMNARVILKEGESP